MTPFKQYINSNSNRFVDELKAFLRIPSISANINHKSDISAAADFLVKALEKVGMLNINKFETEGNPIVFAENFFDPSLPTVLLYGHYDVQPAEPIELWESPPFEPEIREGRIFARGACDDKAQVYLIIKALELLSNIDTPCCNVKVVFEGEEEIGSVSLTKFIQHNQSLLKANTLLVCDTSMPSQNQPALICGLRGIVYCEIEAIGVNRDLHSGMYGGTIVNPLFELSKVLSLLKDNDGRVAIPNFYDDLIGPTSEISAMVNQNFKYEELFPDELKNQILKSNSYSLAEQMTLQPTLDINGMWGGYTEEGPKTIIPSKVNAKVSMRLGLGQDHLKISNLFEEFLISNCDQKIKIQMNKSAGCNAVCFNPINNSSKVASEALLEVFGTRPLYTFIGGSIPVVSTFIEFLDVEPLLMGFGLDNDNIHAPNESFLLDNYFKGIETISIFLSSYK